MNRIEIFEHRKPPNVTRYEWQPYDDVDAFNRYWWTRLPDVGGRYSLWSAEANGLELARIKLDREVSYDHYDGVPHLGADVLEVDLFEVSSAMRCQGIGRTVLELLAGHFPGVRLVAFSEKADGFWSSLGWLRYDHPEGFPAYRPLFVAPDSWPADTIL